jgi:hypothetical protein
VDARQRAYVYKAEVAQQLGAAAAASNGGGRLGALRGVASHHLNLRQMPSGRPMSRVHIRISPLASDTAALQYGRCDVSVGLHDCRVNIRTS